jgi:hypothetical protein
MTLAAKVEATNLVNRLAREIDDKINTILEPYIGKKVIKTTPYRTFIKKISDEMDILRAGYGCSIIFYFYSCSISVEVSYRFSVSTPSFLGTERVTKTIAIAEISLDILSSLKEPEEYTEYTLEEVEATINKIKELDDEIYALRGKILPFVNR